MAPNRSPALLAVALLLLLAAPLTLAQVPPPQTTRPTEPVVPPEQIPEVIKITGVLCCAPDGCCSGGPGIAGVNYTARCSSVGSMGSFVAAKGSTGVNGAFTVTLTDVPALSRSMGLNILYVLDGRLPCEILIDLPIDRALCRALGSVNGVLAGRLWPNGTASTTGLKFTLNFKVSFGLWLH